MKDPSTGGGGGGGGGGDSGNTNILSEKVARALQVRTDTPAMKAALEALANLHVDTNVSAAEKTGKKNVITTDPKTTSTASAIPIDSRSVRMAIEQDALATTLLLEGELRNLVTTISKLREGIAETVAIADRVCEAVYTPVITVASKTKSLPTPSTIDDNDDPANSMGPVTSIDTQDMADHTMSSNVGASHKGTRTTSPEDALQLEAQLAAQLSDSFLRRDQAKKRLAAVQAFLEKFNLSEQDSRLLDHYSFEDMDDIGANTPDQNDMDDDNYTRNNPINGLAFLAALERTRKIRSTLEQTTLSEDGNYATGTQNDGNRLGASSALRMMETLALKQEQAYERLYHWLQKYLNLHAHHNTATTSNIPTSSNNPDSVQDECDRLDELLSHPFVKRALYTLRNVPAFYSHTLELIASSRRSHQTKRFLLALTSGYSGFPPIEMKAHDSVAYVGDMLAFCFRAFSVEADVAKGLINYKPKSESYNKDNDDVEGANDEDDENKNSNADDDDNSGNDGEETTTNLDDVDEFLEKPFSAQDMLSVSISGLARPLKSRIFQVISTLSRRPDDGEEEEDDDDMIHDEFDEEGAAARIRATQLYEVCGLLLFYASAVDTVIHKVDSSNSRKKNSENGDPSDTFSSTIKTKNPLVDAILDCLAECTSAYEAAFKVYTSMLDQLSVLTGESEASIAHAIIVKLADVRIASPGFSKDVPCPKEFQTTLSIEWVVETLTETTLTSGCNTLDDTVTLKRSIMVGHKADMSVVVASKLNEKIDQKENYLIDELVKNETDQVLDFCGLNPLVSSYQAYLDEQAEGGEDVTVLSSYPGLTINEIETCMKEFYSSLYSPPLPSLEHNVKDPFIRKSARKKIADNVCLQYEKLYQAVVTSSDTGYDESAIRAVFGHTPEQVRTLFSA